MHQNSVLKFLKNQVSQSCSSQNNNTLASIQKQLHKEIECFKQSVAKPNLLKQSTPKPSLSDSFSPFVRYSYTFSPSGPTSANPSASCDHKSCVMLFTFVFQFENSVLSAARSDVDSSCHTIVTTNEAAKLILLRFSFEMSVKEYERSVAKPFSACFKAAMNESLSEAEAD